VSNTSYILKYYELECPAHHGTDQGLCMPVHWHASPNTATVVAHTEIDDAVGSLKMRQLSHHSLNILQVVPHVHVDKMVI